APPYQIATHCPITPGFNNLNPPPRASPNGHDACSLLLSNFYVYRRVLCPTATTDTAEMTMTIGMMKEIGAGAMICPTNVSVTKRRKPYAVPVTAGGGLGVAEV